MFFTDYKCWQDLYTIFSSDLKPGVFEVMVVSESNLSAPKAWHNRVEKLTNGQLPPLSKVQGCIASCACLLFENLSNLAQPDEILSSTWGSWSVGRGHRAHLICRFYIMFKYLCTLLTHAVTHAVEKRNSGLASFPLCMYAANVLFCQAYRGVCWTSQFPIDVVTVSRWGP